MPENTPHNPATPSEYRRARREPLSVPLQRQKHQVHHNRSGTIPSRRHVLCPRPDFSPAPLPTRRLEFRVDRTESRRGRHIMFHPYYPKTTPRYQERLAQYTARLSKCLIRRKSPFRSLRSYSRGVFRDDFRCELRAVRVGD